MGFWFPCVKKLESNLIPFIFLDIFPTFKISSSMFEPLFNISTCFVICSILEFNKVMLYSRYMMIETYFSFSLWITPMVFFNLFIVMHASSHLGYKSLYAATNPSSVMYSLLDSRSDSYFPMKAITLLVFLLHFHYQSQAKWLIVLFSISLEKYGIQLWCDQNLPTNDIELFCLC